MDTSKVWIEYSDTQDKFIEEHRYHRKRCQWSSSVHVEKVIGNMTLNEDGCAKTVENHIHTGIIRNQPMYLIL